MHSFLQEVRRLRNGKTLPQGNRGDNDGATFQRSQGMANEGSAAIGGASSPLPKTDSQFDLWHLEREKEKEERQTLVLWRRPLQTLYYSVLETGHVSAEYTMRLLRKRRLIVLLICLVSILGALYAFDGPHQEIFAAWRNMIVLCLYWVGLGILSSVGLGTGLHTFLIYLGPFIAQVTMAAFECHSLDFPEPPYPDEIHCPSVKGSSDQEISLWAIMGKVRLEAFMWGAGTAIGELPPYFMARAARLSGLDPDDEEFDEFAELIHDDEKRKKGKDEGEKLPLFQRLKLSVHHFVQRVGFLGILVCASVPNPLFDLAGITCGHFLIPFWTFFGATLIGKAIIKMHIQKLFVIIAFSKHHMEIMLRWVAALPAVGKTLHNFLETELKVQREKFRASPAERNASASAGGKNVIGWVFEKLVIIMILYFVLSIVNSMAQSYHKRLFKRRQKNNQNNAGKRH